MKNNKIWFKSKRGWLFGLSLSGFSLFLTGILFLAGANTFMQETSTMEFCLGCHEMRDNVYEEYTKSIHYKNASGVRAECADCHIPKDWGPKALSKLYAANDVYHKIKGTVDTPEKFEKRRLKMAESVWAKMKSNDSRECRNCHDYESMDKTKQDRLAKKKHDPEKLAIKNKTCIDCHQGLVHKLPDDY